MIINTLLSTNTSEQGQKKERDIFLNESIDQISITYSMSTIIDINKEDDSNEEIIKDYIREPINIYLNTQGGDIYAGLSLISCIENSRTPIHIYTGFALSMGLPILLSGHKRIISKYGTVMYHEVGMPDGIAGQATLYKQEVKEMERLQEIIDGIILKNTKIKKKDLEKIKDSKSDWYISAEEALELGIVDEIQ